MGRDRSGRGRLGLLPQFGVPPGTVPWQMDELGDQSLAKQGDGLAWIRWVHEEGLLTMKGVATLSRVGWRVRPLNVLDRLVAAAAGGVRWAETGRTGERGQMCGSNSAQAEQHRCRREQAAKRHKRGSSPAGQVPGRLTTVIRTRRTRRSRWRTQPTAETRPATRHTSRAILSSMMMGQG